MTGNGETNEDLTAHRESYARFMWYFKNGAVVVAVIVAAVVFIISR